MTTVDYRNQPRIPANPNQNPLDPNKSRLELRRTQSHNWVPAGFWIRSVATVVDWCIVCILLIPIGLILAVLIFYQGTTIEDAGQHISLMIFNNVVQFAVSFVYFGWFYQNKGGTPGKLLLGLRVVDRNTGTNI